MALHRAFIVAGRRRFVPNLRRALGMLTDDPNLKPILPDAAADLWVTLSLLVPVVSTTFASVASCFKHMRADSIAWLFIDEAGQAVPHHALGALFRARRAVVLGDPLQVPPVVTLDRCVDDALRLRYKAPARHLASGTSLQALADGANPFGATLPGQDGADIWVGSPLKVHRRCVEPMFTIANRIAYGGTMVLARDKLQEERRLTEGDPQVGLAPRPLIGASAWIDVPGADNAPTNFMPAQAQIVSDIVAAFMREGWLNVRVSHGLPDLFVISPFRLAAQGMRDRLWRSRNSWAPTVAGAVVDEWLARSVGTIHTFQVREAESVVVLLGGRNPGAIQWAASTPNKLNVAVTRAQRRLYLVGDWEAWMQWPVVSGSMRHQDWRISAQCWRTRFEHAVGRA